MNSSTWKYAIVLALIVVGSRVAIHEATGFTTDDAFITYRYAENLALGKGFVYNVGENVQGTSTPLYTFILAASALVFGPASIPEVSQVLGIFADTISILVLLKITRGWGISAQFLCAMLFALFPREVFISTLGMEAPFVVMLMLLSFLLVQKNMPTAACLMIGLLILTRIDTIIWSGMLMFLIWKKQKGIPVFGIVIVVSLCAGWLAYAWSTFGTVVPHAITAKNVSWNHLFSSFDPVRIMLGYFPLHGLREFSIPAQILLILVLILPVAVILPSLIRRNDIVMIFPLFFILYNFAFSFGRIIMADWYYLPGLTAWFICVGQAWFWFSAKSRLSVFFRRFDRIVPFLVTTILLAALVMGTRSWVKDPGEWFQREQVRLGTYLKVHAPKGSSVFLEPIGYVGWATKLYIHDAVGLVSPRVLEYRQRYAGTDRWFYHFLADTRPTFIVLQSRELTENKIFLGYGDELFRDTAEEEWFYAHYREITEADIDATQQRHEYRLFGIVDENSI